MALPNIFTSTPVEAGIWTAAVGTQVEIARTISSSQVFIVISAIAVGIATIRFLLQLGSGDNRRSAVLKFVTFLAFVAIGISFLKKENTVPFTPTNSMGRAWKQVPKVSANKKYKDVQINTNGLFWYTLMHRGMLEIAYFVTGAVSRVASDPTYKSSPEFLINALAQTTRATIDDPAIERDFDTLVFNCSDKSAGRILGPLESIRSMFDLSRQECGQLYNQLQAKLKTWAAANRPKIFAPVLLAHGVPSAYADLGLTNTGYVDNKIIASAVKNYARVKAGESSSITATNNAALIDGTDTWVNISKALSADGLLMAYSFLSGDRRDLESAAARNEIAITYNRLLQFLPAIRGYALAILAYTFVVAALALSIGLTGMFLGWLRMSAIFCLYIPFSAALYQFTTRLIATTENINAMQAIANDPFVIGGASIIDANLSRIQVVYFALQISLVLVFAIAGIRAFHPIQNIRGTFLSGIIRNGFYAISTAARVASGAPPSMPPSSPSSSHQTTMPSSKSGKSA